MSDRTLTTHRLARSEASIGDAWERVYEAGQRLVVRRLDLMVEEVRLLARYAGLGLVGATLVLWGWLVAMGAVIDGLSHYAPRFAVAILVGTVHVAAGAALVWRLGEAWKRLEGPN